MSLQPDKEAVRATARTYRFDWRASATLTTECGTSVRRRPTRTAPIDSSRSDVVLDRPDDAGSDPERQAMQLPLIDILVTRIISQIGTKWSAWRTSFHNAKRMCRSPSYNCGVTSEVGHQERLLMFHPFRKNPRPVSKSHRKSFWPGGGIEPKVDS